MQILCITSHLYFTHKGTGMYMHVPSYTCQTHVITYTYHRHIDVSTMYALIYFQLSKQWMINQILTLHRRVDALLQACANASSDYSRHCSASQALASYNASSDDSCFHYTIKLFVTHITGLFTLSNMYALMCLQITSLTE